MKKIGLDVLYRYLNGIGGCDASDEYTKGWDAAVNCIIDQIDDWRKEEPVIIVKFQRTLMGGNKVLVYDKKETIYQELPMTGEIKKLFGGRLKMYRKCSLDGKGMLHIGKEVRANF